MIPSIYLPEARDDVDEAYAHYEAIRPGLGDRFLTALSKRVEHVENSPALFGELLPGVRAVLLKKFPFVLYYRPDPSPLTIIAIRHGKENPRVWQRRV